MSPPRVDELFERFCTTGDVRALARVFDATASELFRVASYLAGDTGAAEDLVQATFLTAIESRTEFEAGRPVVPWLLGILGNHVRSWRRRRRRIASPIPALEAVGGDPVAAAAGNELRQQCEHALERLESPYRQVLELHLVHGLTSKEIARVLERPGGTVRTQIVRGLELLRRALPAGFVAGAVVTVCTTAQLAAMRRVVLGQVGSHTAAAGTVAGALIMTQKTTASVAVVLAVLLCGILLWSPWTGSAESGLAPDVAGAQQGGVAVAANAGSVDARSSGAAPADAVPSRLAAQSSGARDGSAMLLIRFVWDGDRAPIAQRRFELLSDMLGHSNASRTRVGGVTDARGECRLDGLDPGTLFVAVMNSWRRVELVAGEVTECTFAEERWAVVRGRVVDPAGEPVAAATVFSGFPHSGIGHAVRADDAGRFSIDIARPHVLWADKSGHARSHEYHVDLVESEQVELELVLRGAERVVDGFVHDADGAPIRGAEILVEAAFANVEPLTDRTAVRGQMPTRRERTDASGRFRVAGLGPEAFLVYTFADGFAAARTPLPAGATALDVELAHGARVHGHVTSSRTAHLRFGRVSLRPLRHSSELGHDPDRALSFGGHLTCSTVVTQDGGFDLADLPAGDWRVVVDAGEAGEVSQRVTLSPGQSVRWDPVLDRGRVISGRVIDASGGPLAGWQVSALSCDGDNDRRAVWTGADGTFAMPNVRDTEYVVRVRTPDRGGTGLVRYGVRAGTPVELRITEQHRPTAVLRGRVVAPDGEAGDGTHVWVSRPGSGSYERHETERGAFELGPLAPGTYLLAAEVRGQPRAFLGRFELAAHEVRELGDLRLSAPGTLIVRTDADSWGVYSCDDYPLASFEDDRPAELTAGRYLVRDRLGRHTAVVVRPSVETIVDLASLATVRTELQFRAEDPVRMLSEVHAELRDAAGDLIAIGSAWYSNDEPSWTVALEPGRYRVDARSMTGLRAALEIDVMDDRTIVLRLR